MRATKQHLNSTSQVQATKHTILHALSLSSKGLAPVYEPRWAQTNHAHRAVSACLKMGGNWEEVKRRICTLAVTTATLLGAELRYEWENMNRLIWPNVSLSPHLMYFFSVQTTLPPCKNYTKTDVPKQCTPSVHERMQLSHFEKSNSLSFD